jgi:hypothetical protein
MDQMHETDMERLKQALSILREHYDTVQLFATRHEEGTKHGTVHCSLGFGNWFARFGQVTHWLQRTRHENETEAEDKDP